MKVLSWFMLFVGIMSIIGCDRNITSLEVTATAYTSSIDETNSNPSLAAWGDTLRPGMKAISVSEDLIKKGLSHGVKVSIAGLEGKYTVLDKMNKRWTNKIDIYMGTDKKAAKEWGKRKVVISWKNKNS
jgi:3D (Asp-Asp-Asp) domain-containing protein